MITYFTHLRPFENEFRVIQEMATLSWDATHPRAQILGFHEMDKAALYVDLPYETFPVSTNAKGISFVSSIFASALLYAQREWMCFVSSDIIVSANILLVLESIKHWDRPFVVAQRIDIDPQTKQAQYHAPSAIDFMLFRRGSIPDHDIPNFLIGRTAYDNWFLWAATELWGMETINATKILPLLHLNHSYNEYGTREKLWASQDRQYNLTLAQATGCDYWPGTDDTLYYMDEYSNVHLRRD